MDFNKAVKKVVFLIDGYKEKNVRRGCVPKISPMLPNKNNPVIVRVMTRSELAAIPRDRYKVKVIKVMVPLQDNGEVGGEEELMVAITNIKLVEKQLNAFRQNFRSILRSNNGGGGGPSSTNLFNSPVNEDMMSDCIMNVIEDFFHGEENCTICNREYSIMEFCVLMHMYFKYIGFLKNKSRLSYSTFLQEKVFASKSKFGERTYNTYSNKEAYQTLEKQLKNMKVDFNKHPKLPPDPKESILKPAFQEIGWAFQHSRYIKDLIELRNDLQRFKI